MNRRLTVLELERRVTPTAGPVGPEFGVNLFTAGNQALSPTAADSVGNFVVVWQSTGQDGAGTGIYAQRYSATGVPAGPEFRVNTVTTGNQAQPAIGMNAAGTFVIAWVAPGPVEAGNDIMAQRFDATGTPQGGEFTVNSTTLENQTGASVAVDGDGDFIVAWGDTAGSLLTDVRARRFSAAGVPQGNDFIVHNTITGVQQAAAVVADAAGEFTVFWKDTPQSLIGGDILFRRFSALGVPLMVEASATGTGLTDKAEPRAVGTPAGMVVTWRDFTTGQSQDVYARRLDSAGNPLGIAFRINEYTTASQQTARVAMDASGGFVAVWASESASGQPDDVFARTYAADGTPTSGEILVNSTTADDQSLPSVAMDAAGNFIVAWTSAGQDGSGTGIFAQRFDATPPPRVESIRIMDGMPQRSSVRELTVTFDQLVTFANDPATAFAFSLSPSAVSIAVDLSQSTSARTIARLTFSGEGTQFNSLVDGQYTLSILSSIIHDGLMQALDGDNDGNPGGNATFSFHRLFGDADGDNDVDTTDYAAFRAVFGGSSAIFDFDNDGDVDTADFGQFRQRFGMAI